MLFKRLIVGVLAFVAGATSAVLSPLSLGVQLTGATTTELVFRTALDAGLQIRGMEIRRESIETAFLRVIGEQPAGPQ